MYCPKCGSKIDASAFFCGKCGSSIDNASERSEVSERTASHFLQNMMRMVARHTVSKIVTACAICAVLFGGVVYVMHGARKSVAPSNNIEEDSALLDEQENLALDGDASLVVYSNHGYQMSEYDVTLIGVDGESIAYHVDHAWGGCLLSELGVKDGTYEVIVTDQLSGDSATLDDVVVNSQSNRAKTYEIGTEDETHSEVGWSYMDNATNRLEAANLFWKQCQELQEKYGTPSTFTDVEFNVVYPTGLCFVDLLDVNEDGVEEMVVCYIDRTILEENIANRSSYGSAIKDPGWIQVFQYNRQYHDLYNELATATGISAGMGAIGFTHDVPEGVGLVKCDLNKGRYERLDLTGEHFERKLYSDYGASDYYRDGKEVGPTEATQGIQDLLSNCTLYHLCGEIDPAIPAEIVPYAEVERVTQETLDYISHADEVLFENPKQAS